MTPEHVAAYLKVEVPKHYGRRLYAIVGSYDQLRSVEIALEQADLPEALPVALRALEMLGDAQLDALTRFEPRTSERIRRELLDSYRRLVKEAHTTHDLAILKDFELLFQYGVDLNIARNLAIGDKAVVMMVPGRTDHQSIFAYAAGAEDGYAFFPGLFEPEHILEVN